MIYKASLDKTAIFITLAVTVLFVIIIGGGYILITDNGRGGFIYTTATCLIIYFITFAFRPISYFFTENEIFIRRMFKSVRIKISDIRSVELVNDKQMKGAIRIFGVGGLFGYYGNFSNSSLGKMTWYATRRDYGVLFETKNNIKILITPDEADKFVVDFKSHLKA